VFDPGDKDDCWDNVPTESLWGSLNVGRLYGRRFATQRVAMDEVIDWLTFYNHRRLHSTLGCLSPKKFEEDWRAGQAKRAA
jgi:putative transposase